MDPTDGILGVSINGKHYNFRSDLIIHGSTADQTEAIQRRLIDISQILVPNPADYLRERLQFGIDGLLCFVAAFLPFCMQFPKFDFHIDMLVRIKRILYVAEGVMAGFGSIPARCRGAIFRTPLDAITLMKWAVKSHPLQEQREKDIKYEAVVDLLRMMLGAVMYGEAKGLHREVLFCRILFHCGIPVRRKYCWMVRPQHDDRSRICGHFAIDIFE